MILASHAGLPRRELGRCRTNTIRKVTIVVAVNDQLPRLRETEKRARDPNTNHNHGNDKRPRVSLYATGHGRAPDPPQRATHAAGPFSCPHIDRKDHDDASQHSGPAVCAIMHHEASWPLTRTIGSALLSAPPYSILPSTPEAVFDLTSARSPCRAFLIEQTAGRSWGRPRTDRRNGRTFWETRPESIMAGRA